MLHPRRATGNGCLMLPALNKIMVAIRERTTRPALQTAICPRCGHHIPFDQTQLAEIDSSGFECYRFSCNACATPLAGVIDPYDGALLLSELKD